MGVDLVGVDLVGVDLKAPNRNKVCTDSTYFKKANRLPKVKFIT